MAIAKIFAAMATALAIAALAVPAARANETWTTDGEPIPGEGNKTTVEVHGQLSSKVGAFTTGPAIVHGHGKIWNGESMGEGEVDSFMVTGELAVGPGLPMSCKATVASEVLPWPVTLTTEAADMTMHVVYSYNASCQALGFPASVSVGGTLTGSVNGECLQLVNAGDLETAGGQPWSLNGNICITDLNAEGETTEGVIGTEPVG